MKSVGVVFAVLFVTACSPKPPYATPEDQYGPQAEACREGGYAWLIGADAGQLPYGRLPKNRRVMDHTMKYTQDYIEGRLNVIFDKATGKVVRVFCG